MTDQARAAYVARVLTERDREALENWRRNVSGMDARSFAYVGIHRLLAIIDTLITAGVEAERHYDLEHRERMRRQEKLRAAEARLTAVRKLRDAWLADPEGDIPIVVAGHELERALGDAPTEGTET